MAGRVSNVTTTRVSRLIPNRGPSVGGTLVTVMGAGLSTTNRITFGGTNATSVTVIDDNTVTCITPANAQGLTLVSVYTTTYSYTLFGFTYLDPQSLPPGRQGLWRVSLHRRHFIYDGTTNWMGTTKIADLVDCRSRRLTQQLNQPAQFVFSVPGDSPTANEVIELATDVIVWRWDFRSNSDVPIFTGCVTQSQDTVSEQEHTINFTAQDYLAMLKRRFLTTTLTEVQRDQDYIVSDLLQRAQNVQPSSGGNPWAASAGLGMSYTTLRPDGTTRPPSTVLRDRTYLGQQQIWDALYNLSRVAGGFDLDVDPTNTVRVFYPNRGIQRTTWLLEYPSTVAALTRSINSANYGNYVRMLGESDLNQPQLYSEIWNADSYDQISNPAGLWMVPDSASDVTAKTTLDQRAAGDLAYYGAMINEGAHGARIPLPSYTVQLRPGAYYYGCANMGDTVNLVVRKGRLNINSWVQIVGITYDIGDDGQEDILFDLGQPSQSFIDLMTTANQRVSSLERR